MSSDSGDRPAPVPLDPLDEAAAREIFSRGIGRYLKRTRARIAPFVDDHFSLSGTLALHRRAIGWDLLRAPVNVVLVLPQGVLLLGSAIARRLGWRKGADWLGGRQLLLPTDVAREIDWLVHSELLRLPCRRGSRASPRDALAEAVFADSRIAAARGEVLARLARGAADAGFRRDLEDKLGVYTGSRSAASELSAGLVSVAVGAAAFKKLTPGVLSLGPLVASAAAQHAAIASFPLGAGLGGLWYGAFPASPGPLATIGVTLALALAFSVLSAFAGIVADPVQRALGMHQRRLGRLVDALERELRGEGPERFEVRDHYVARIIDVADLLRAAWSKFH